MCLAQINMSILTWSAIKVGLVLATMDTLNAGILAYCTIILTAELYILSCLWLWLVSGWDICCLDAWIIRKYVQSTSVHSPAQSWVSSFSMLDEAYRYIDIFSPGLSLPYFCNFWCCHFFNFKLHIKMLPVNNTAQLGGSMTKEYQCLITLGHHLF